MAPNERLEAWKASHELVLAVYRGTVPWPEHERFGLTSQIRRAAASVATNIAEGSAKRGGREFRRYLDISLGSLAEVTYLLRLSRDLHYLDDKSWATLEGLRDRAGKLIWGLYRGMSRRASP